MVRIHPDGTMEGSAEELAVYTAKLMKAVGLDRLYQEQTRAAMRLQSLAEQQEAQMQAQAQPEPETIFCPHCGGTIQIW